jgi:hypothetical protein
MHSGAKGSGELAKGSAGKAEALNLALDECHSPVAHSTVDSRREDCYVTPIRRADLTSCRKQDFSGYAAIRLRRVYDGRSH